MYCEDVGSVIHGAPIYMLHSIILRTLHFSFLMLMDLLKIARYLIFEKT